ncbi:hypothetical protein MA20_34915 [Bradyrhizobium japonicum]|uniref:Uncharacterized protein n=1 Tax=Bradyrhizobium japonicum TaxID=375 RepID=A0A0A3XPN4_BRAJP|nr:hypothetical protein MA20_34915 [Bradyrhizobium japonicum]
MAALEHRQYQGSLAIEMLVKAHLATFCAHQDAIVSHAVHAMAVDETLCSIEPAVADASQLSVYRTAV